MTRPAHYALSCILAVATMSSAHAQTLNLGDAVASGDATARIVQVVAALSMLSIAPTLVVMMTSFTRIVVALSFLRSGLGLQSTPGNVVIITLALFMTYFVMSDTFQQAWTDGVEPLAAHEITERQALERGATPFREFMQRHVRARDLQMFRELAKETQSEQAPADPPFRVLAPAFMISELRRGFEIGFLIALPFLVIDLVVATLTMAMGMMMLPPSVISLPAKVIFFVLIDGWGLVVGGLIRSYR